MKGVLSTCIGLKLESQGLNQDEQFKLTKYNTSVMNVELHSAEINVKFEICLKQ